MSSHIVDTHVRDATLFRDTRGFFDRLRKLRSDVFFDHYAKKVFEKGGFILDIGGGLRLDPKRGNVTNSDIQKKLGAEIARPDVQFKISDYTDKYSPDFVEDIHQLSFSENTLDGLFCLAVLEHVYDPKKAAEEIVRVLKPGGRAFIYVPFLYRYHAHRSDYKDYYRYSKDGIAYLFRGCSHIEICPVRGFFESLLKFTPLSSLGIFRFLARLLDESCSAMRSVSERQTSGYNIYLIK